MGRVLRSKAVNENTSPSSAKKQTVKEPTPRSCRKVLSDQTNTKGKMDEEKNFKGLDAPPSPSEIKGKKRQASIRRYLTEKQEKVKNIKAPRCLSTIPENTPRTSKSPKEAHKTPEQTPHVPVYKKPVSGRKKSSVKNPDMMYNFEVDENEPKAKRKRKRILKMKFMRHKNAHNTHKPLGELPPLPGFEEEERCVRIQEQEAHPAENVLESHPDIVPEEIPVPDLEVSDQPSLNISTHSNKPRKTVAKQPDIHIPVLYSSFDAPSTSYMGERTINSTLLDVPASTPVKFNTLSSSAQFQSHLEINGFDFNASNCFGFDEAEEIEEPLISPIKDPFMPSYTPEKAKKPSPVKEVCVQNVIKLLQFDTKTDTSSLSPKSDDGNNIFEEKSVRKTREQSPGPIDVNFKKAPRRSYVRPFKKRLDKSYEESSEDEEPVVVKKTKPRKRNQASKKQEMALEKWAAAFNSQCMEVEQFDLCIE